MNLPVVDVAVAVVAAPDGLVLMAERTPRQLAAGFWELPGGKIEPGETPAQAAERELFEETGLQAASFTPFMAYDYAFATKRVRLRFFKAAGWTGTPRGQEGQRIAWVDPASHHTRPVLPSNDRVLFALSLPPSYFVADAGIACAADLIADVHNALSHGARLVRIRQHNAAPGQAASLLRRVATVAAPFNGATLLASNVADACRAGFEGVHSCSRELRRLTARPAIRVWGATCHGEADVEHAVRLGADFVVVSPVLRDPATPHQAPLGWDALRRFAAMPVAIYAQGGLIPAHAAQAREAGAKGLVVGCGDVGTMANAA